MLAFDNREIIYVGVTVEGKIHDKALCDKENLTIPTNCTLWQDLGYQGNNPEGVTVKMPIKKRKKVARTEEEKEYNRKISSKRVIIENALAGVKILAIVQNKIRTWKTRIRDLVMMIACGLHNFRVRFRAKNIN